MCARARARLLAEGVAGGGLPTSNRGWIKGRGLQEKQEVGGESGRTAELRRLDARQRQRSKHNCLGGGGGAQVPPGAPAHVLPPGGGVKEAGPRLSSPACRRSSPSCRPRSPLVLGS